MQKDPDFIVIGSGIAGVRAAIELAAVGTVAVLTKSRADESNTEYAQGGVAVVLNDDDEITLHERDTLAAGDGLCDQAAVSTLVREGPARIEELIAWGAAFDREGSRLAFTREAAHSRRRVLHAGGDSTGQEINRTLIRRVRQMKRARLYAHCCAFDLRVEDGRCTGVRYLSASSGRVEEMRASAVMLATGGLGRLYRESTNPEVATGDGFALAFEAGAALADMEFVQFHPTALKVEGAPRFLLSEALRGEGGRLRNQAGDRFMPRYHEAAELAPRDIVSRAIFMEAKRRQESQVYLDLTHLESAFLRRRFPRIYRTCLTFGLDFTHDQIPVFPAAHYMMGGVYTDLMGRTTIPGLFAAGEVACLGVHGANRLASNSLLDGLVFGKRAGQAMTLGAEWLSPPGEPFARDTFPAEPPRHKAESREIRRLMTERVGIIRSRAGLTEAVQQLQSLGEPEEVTQSNREIRSLLLNGRLVAAAALLRTESRGGHFRKDFSRRDDARWRCHLLVLRTPDRRGLTWNQSEALQPTGTSQEPGEPVAE